MNYAKKTLAVLSLVAPRTIALAAADKGLDPTRILEPLKDSWLTYSGDYSGKRYSALTQINQTNVKNLSLAWSARFQSGLGPGGGRGFGFGGGDNGPRTII